MKTFRTKKYFISSEKVEGEPIRLAVLADLHGLQFGKQNQELFQAVISAGADAAVIAGDMVVSSEPASREAVAGFLCRLGNTVPVFYALGNHEYKMLLNPETREAYLNYERVLTSAGVCFLHNECVSARIHGTEMVFHGLELPIEYYRKPFSPGLTQEKLEELAGRPKTEGFQVLIAHNPKYGDTYLDWGADLTLCGHYHGGILRLGEHRGLTCPQFLLFPPYCCGDFEREGRSMIVSAGLGEHTIPVRIHNPRELLIVEISAPAKTGV